MKKFKKLFFCTGGTGGHVFPAISLYENFKNSNHQIIFLTDKRCEYILKENKINYKIINVANFNRKIFLWPISLYTIIKSILECMKLFLIEKPDTVVGFGSYVSFPSLISAKLLKITTIIHEQNAVMGKSNRILSKIVDYIALSYKNTKFCKLNEKVFYTGMPIRSIFYKKKIKKNIYKKQILIIGGSQGARIFSTLIPNLLKKLDNKFKEKIFICQQTQINQKKHLQNLYKDLNIEFKLESFFKDIYREMCDADLIISRCGASSLAEIETFSIPTFLFPLPHSKNDHQYENARRFSEKNECIIFDEIHLNEKEFIHELKKKIINKVSKKLYKKNKRNLRLKELVQRTLDR